MLNNEEEKDDAKFYIKENESVVLKSSGFTTSIHFVDDHVSILEGL
jgi:hypothetical protein